MKTLKIILGVNIMVFGGIEVQQLVDSFVIRAVINDKDLSPSKSRKPSTIKKIKNRIIKF